MIFIWKDGHTEEIEFGKKLVGLSHNHERPHRVVITEYEVATYDVPQGAPMFYEAKNYIENNVKPALAQDGTLEITTGF